MPLCGCVGCRVLNHLYPARIHQVLQLFSNLLLPREYLKKESLIIGDLNTGCRYWDEGRMDLSLVEEFGALIGCEWTDVWRMRNPTLREWSWVKPWASISVIE